MEELTAVNDRRHSEGFINTGEVVVNMAIAISARDLYEKIKAEGIKQGLTEEKFPSFSWFKFQFWPKDCTTHSALNYTGRFPVKYMMQQRMVRKAHDDDHYANAIFKYTREYAVNVPDHCSFICTDDKHKISVGEPGFPLSTLPRRRRVLVGLNKTYQVGDHDFSTVSLISTVILLNDIPEEVDGSWYRGKSMVSLKITATDPSSALRNAKEIANVLIEKYDTKENVPPVLILYTDGGPEHRTTFLSVKIAMISLQKYLNLDQILAVRTAPGHLYRNPAEKVNCVLNLGLYGIGCMRQGSSDIEFEENLHRCNGLGDVRDLLNKDFQRNSVLLKSSCKPCLDIISETFSRLRLKDQSFSVYEPCSLDDIDIFFKCLELDEELNPMDTKIEFPKRPKLLQYLSHCGRERTYFVSF